MELTELAKAVQGLGLEVTWPDGLDGFMVTREGFTIWVTEHYFPNTTLYAVGLYAPSDDELENPLHLTEEMPGLEALDIITKLYNDEVPS
jgi:hypothetical protein